MSDSEGWGRHMRLCRWPFWRCVERHWVRFVPEDSARLIENPREK